MGCNAWNHPDDCDCGWGGDTGDGHVWPPAPAAQTQFSDGFVNPNARCPVCEKSVFYYESEHGGKVWFDELGPPWPKHPCMASRSASISSYGEFLEFTGTPMSPTTAMKTAAELVRYAMSDFREPKRDWPDEELLEARAELLDWMFSRHSSNADHLVPLAELLRIIGFIEARADLHVKDLPSWQGILGDNQDGKSKKNLETFTKLADEGRRTLAVMSQVRARYDKTCEDRSDGLRLIDKSAE